VSPPAFPGETISNGSLHQQPGGMVGRLQPEPASGDFARR
jgi:hypothetical protein